MARKSKGFGELLRLQKKSQTSSQARQEWEKGLQSLKIVSPDERKPANPSNFEQQERRIGEIIGVDEDGEVFAVNDKTLGTYQNYLKQYFKFPVTLRHRIFSLGRVLYYRTWLEERIGLSKKRCGLVNPVLRAAQLASQSSTCQIST